MSSFDTNCNSLSPRLANIVIFELSLSDFHSRFLNTSVSEMFPHPYRECFVLLPNRRGISQSTSFQGLASSLTLVPLSNRCEISQSTCLQDPTSSVALKLLSNRCGILQSTLFQGLASSLAHRLIDVGSYNLPLRSSISSLTHHPVSSSYLL